MCECEKDLISRYKKGYLYRDVSNKDLGVIECSCLKQLKKEQSYKYLLSNTNLSMDDYKRSFEDYIGEKSKNNLKHLASIVNNYFNLTKNCLYVTGEYGTQKTTQIKSFIAKLAFETSLKADIISHQKLVDTLVDLNESKDKKSYFYNVPILAIDDAFELNRTLVYATGSQAYYIDSLIRSRLENKKLFTIIISSVIPSKIDSKKFGQSIFSVINREFTKKNTLEFKDVYFSVLNNDKDTAFNLFD